MIIYSGDGRRMDYATIRIWADKVGILRKAVPGTCSLFNRFLFALYGDLS